jgi:hypothetical protein
MSVVDVQQNYVPSPVFKSVGEVTIYKLDGRDSISGSRRDICSPPFSEGS